MFYGYYRKQPYRPGLRLGPVGGYGGMYAPDWMVENALESASKCECFNCHRPCGCCGGRRRRRRFLF